MIDTGLTASSEDEARKIVISLIADKLKSTSMRNKKLKAIKDKVGYYIVCVDNTPRNDVDGCEEYVVHNNLNDTLFYVYFNYYDF